MNNYKLKLEYNGANFAGSQAQNHDTEVKRTVQAELEKALQSIFKEPVQAAFAGRTDAGVHAIGQVVSFKLRQEIPELEDNPGKFLLSLNAQMPEDLSATKIEAVAEDFHARFSAKEREYMYKIFTRRTRPVLRLDSLAWVKEPLDFDSMQEHAKNFLGEHDFSAYAKDDEGTCIISASELIKESELCFKYKIRANRFLRNMVRRIVGELILVGRGEEPRPNQTAPGQGLTLMKVYY